MIQTRPATCEKMPRGPFTSQRFCFFVQIHELTNSCVSSRAAGIVRTDKLFPTPFGERCSRFEFCILWVQTKCCGCLSSVFCHLFSKDATLLLKGHVDLWQQEFLVSLHLYTPSFDCCFLFVWFSCKAHGHDCLFQNGRTLNVQAYCATKHNGRTVRFGETTI